MPIMRRLVALVAVLALGLSGACGDDRDAQGAKREVDAGLKEHQRGRWGAAERHYREAIKLDDKNKLAYYNLGQIAQTLDKDDEAEISYRKVLELDPDYEPALFNLAILRADAGDSQEAISLYKRAIAVAPKKADAHLNLGLLLKKLGRTEEGDAEIATALRLNPALAGTTGTPDTTASTTTTAPRR